MKITIDTKEDSREEIRKVIRMLSNLVEASSEHHGNMFSDDSDSRTEGNLMGMFDTNQETEEEEKEETEEEEKEEDISVEIVDLD